MLNSEIIREADRYYTKRFREYKDGPLAADWNSVSAQHIRFAQLTKLLPKDRDEPFSVCDFGCGLGDYQEYLENEYTRFSYIGVDVSAEIIKKAREIKRGKYVCDSAIHTPYDYIVASGVFNVCQDIARDKWKEYIISTISMFSRYAVKGFAFNCLTKYSDEDRMQDNLYYGDPLYLFDYCKTHFSRNVALLHDYGIYDFTIIVREDDTWHGRN